MQNQDRDGGSESNKKSSSQNVKEQTKYQLRKDIDGETFVDVDSDIIKESDGRSIASVIAEIIKNKFNNLIETNNQLIRINATTNREWRRSNDAINLLKRSPAVYNDKIKSIANADELLTAAKKWVGEQKYHKKSSNKFVEFARVNNNGYNVAKTTDGRSILYDINKIKNIGHGVVSSNVKSEKTNDKRDSHINPNVSTGRISQFNANVNGSNTKVRDRNTAQIDKDYMSAVKRGDLVEQLARARSKLKKLLTECEGACEVFRKKNFKALTRSEWASYYSSLMNNNQREAFRIRDNGILVPAETGGYKVVCYDEINQSINSIYLLVNYYYNIHNKQPKAETIITKLEKDGYNDKQARTILQSYTNLYGTVFKRYNNNGGRFVNITRKSNSSGTNTQDQSYRGRADSETRQYSDRELWNITDDKLNNSN